jgi:histone acetyltransferase (RNA polymerase elongator complex component)
MIIPFFITHSGCPHQCVFCNQKNITGQTDPIAPATIPQKISSYLAVDCPEKTAHVAFYGGSFTALPFELQRTYLEAVQPFIRSGQIESIRLSTRPDCIASEVLALLKEYHVATIELGVQSMNDAVLTRSGRGHTATHTVNAVSLIKSHDFLLGLQLMPGLPGDSVVSFMKSIDRVIELKPDLVRIYPALVLKDTPLEALYASGRYAPLTLDDAVTMCRYALERFEREGIDVIRIGLQPTEELEKPGTIIAGPYHPAFRQLVESSIIADKMRTMLRSRKEKKTRVAYQLNPSDLSAAIGQRRSTIELLKKEFGLQEYPLWLENVLKRREAVLVSPV